jgi:hypothetical protein
MLIATVSHGENITELTRIRVGEICAFQPNFVCVLGILLVSSSTVVNSLMQEQCQGDDFYFNLFV